MSETSATETDPRFAGLSALDIQTLKLSDQLIQRASDCVNAALMEGDVPQWIMSAEYLTRSRNMESVRGIIEMYEITDPNEYERNFSFTEYDQKMAEQDAENISMMSKLIQTVPAENGNAKILIKAAKPETFWEHKVMVQLPVGSFVRETGYGDGVAQEGKSNLIYFDPQQTVCVENNCQDLATIAKNEGNVIEVDGENYYWINVPYSSPGQTYNEVFSVSLSSDSGNKVEYYDENTGKRRDSGSYIMACVSGVFSGQRKFSIPEQFVTKESTSATS